MVSVGKGLYTSSPRHCLTHRVGFGECGWVNMISESCAVLVVYINIKYIEHLGIRRIINSGKGKVSGSTFDLRL